MCHDDSDVVGDDAGEDVDDDEDANDDDDRYSGHQDELHVEAPLRAIDRHD